MNTFEKQNCWHTIGTNYYIRLFQQKFPSYAVTHYGIEHCSTKYLSGGITLDETLIAERDKPDLYHCDKKNNHSFFGEVKTEPGKSKNFAVQAMSIVSAKVWEHMGDLIYNFVELDNDTKEPVSCQCAYAKDLVENFPKYILIPRTAVCEAWEEWTKHFFPNVEYKKIPYIGGSSGHPFWLLPKKSSYLMDFNLFYTSFNKGI